MFFEAVRTRRKTFLLLKFPANKKILEFLNGWIDYVDVLNEESTEYLIKSAKHIESYHILHNFIEELMRLKSKGEPLETAKYLGKILLILHLKDLHERDQSLIQELVEFLFQNDQVQVAKTVCDNLARKQIDFLNEIYKKYT